MTAAVSGKGQDSRPPRLERLLRVRRSRRLKEESEAQKNDPSHNPAPSEPLLRDCFRPDVIGVRHASGISGRIHCPLPCPPYTSVRGGNGIVDGCSGGQTDRYVVLPGRVVGGSRSVKASAMFSRLEPESGGTFELGKLGGGPG